MTAGIRQWPLLMQRAAAGVVWLIAPAVQEFRRLPGEPLRWAGYIGVLDTVGNAALL
ncbi:hypothetical protein AB4305_14095 [Nocardia sp. 2YAB30]|uniref:hypothetical protein n=1 Tax=unclassified Nocardia TaxID=2637762 RepID=UPI003F9C5AD1